MKIKAFDVPFYTVQKLLLLKVLELSQQAKQSLQTDLQLLVVIFLHRLIHSPCQYHMNLQTKNEGQVLNIDNREYLLEKCQDRIFEHRYFFKEVDHFFEQSISEDIGHKASFIVILCQEVQKIYAILSNLRNVLEASNDDSGQRKGVVDLQLVGFDDFPVAFKDLEEIQEVLKVFMLAIILLNVANNIHRIFYRPQRLFRDESCLEDGNDGAQEMKLHLLYFCVLLSYSKLLLHICYKFIHHCQNTHKQRFYFLWLHTFLQPFTVQVGNDVKTPQVIFQALGRCQQILLQIDIIFRAADKVIANQKVRVLFRIIELNALIESMIEFVLKLLILIAVIDIP